jgi:hypothetical protein
MSKVKGAAQAFHFKQQPRPPVQPANRVEGAKDEEHLDKVVQGKAASDIEERWARALDKRASVSDYEFIVHAITGANLPGEAQLDFLVYSGGQAFAVQIDGGYAHRSAEQKANDAIQDARLSEALKGTISAPMPLPDIEANGLIARIPGYLLETQAAADALVQEMFG